MDIRGELTGSDGTDPFQQEKLDNIPIDADHIAYRVGLGRHSCQLKVNEVHVVAQKHIGRLETVHVDGFHFILLAHQSDFGQHPDETGPELALMHRVFCGFISAFISIIDFNIQKITHLSR